MRLWLECKYKCQDKYKKRKTKIIVGLLLDKRIKSLNISEVRASNLLILVHTVRYCGKYYIYENTCSGCFYFVSYHLYYFLQGKARICHHQFLCP